jgi:hypothetical protein
VATPHGRSAREVKHAARWRVIRLSDVLQDLAGITLACRHQGRINHSANDVMTRGPRRWGLRDRRNFFLLVMFLYERL